MVAFPIWTPNEDVMGTVTGYHMPKTALEAVHFNAL